MAEYTWVWGVGGLLIAAASFFAGWVGRIIKGEAAAETAKAAMQKADQCVADLAAFKTEVARDYASTKMVEQVEFRVVAAIDRLGDRLDTVFEALMTKPSRPAPRTRTTKG